LITLCTNGWA